MATLSLEDIRNEININSEKVGIFIPEEAIEKLYTMYIEGKNVATYEFTHGGVEYMFLGANFTISKLLGVRIANKETSVLVSMFNIKY